MVAYLVTKAHGAWQVGDIRTGDSLSLRQGVRAGMVEPVVECLMAQVSPESTPPRRRKKKADDGEATV